MYYAISVYFVKKFVSGLFALGWEKSSEMKAWADMVEFATGGQAPRFLRPKRPELQLGMTPANVARELPGFQARRGTA